MGGEAKRKKKLAVPTIYHHTSTLRTNLIWMSGVIQIEGNAQAVPHPELGVILTDPLARRDMKDFPAVAWFTTRIDIPRCLVDLSLFIIDRETGDKNAIDVGPEVAHAIALNRVALGFPIAELPVLPWPDYYGYKTSEGLELNKSAREAGDNPDDWYISETPIDVMKVSEFWSSIKKMAPKLVRRDSYIESIRKMVTLCRDEKGVYIPPTWLNPSHAQEWARRMGVNTKEL